MAIGLYKLTKASFSGYGRGFSMYAFKKGENNNSVIYYHSAPYDSSYAWYNAQAGSISDSNDAFQTYSVPVKLSGQSNGGYDYEYIPSLGLGIFHTMSNNARYGGITTSQNVQYNIGQGSWWQDPAAGRMSTFKAWVEKGVVMAIGVVNSGDTLNYKMGIRIYNANTGALLASYDSGFLPGTSYQSVVFGQICGDIIIMRMTGINVQHIFKYTSGSSLTYLGSTTLHASFPSESILVSSDKIMYVYNTKVYVDQIDQSTGQVTTLYSMTDSLSIPSYTNFDGVDPYYYRHHDPSKTFLGKLSGQSTVVTLNKYVWNGSSIDTLTYTISGMNNTGVYTYYRTINGNMFARVQITQDGWGYGYIYDLEIITLTDLAILNAASFSSISKTGITMTSTVNNLYGRYSNSNGWGFCYKLNSIVGDPIVSDDKVSNTVSIYNNGQTMSLSSSGLLQGNTYKIRPYIYTIAGLSYGPSSIVQLLGWENPTNAFAQDAVYTTRPASSGTVAIKISTNGGSTYSSEKTVTLGGSPGALIAGGTSDTWGLSIDGDEMGNAYFKVKIYPQGEEAANDQIYQNFNFTIPAQYKINGVQVQVYGYYSGGVLYIDWISVRTYYGTVPTPVIEGSTAYASNGRKASETEGNGTGTLTFWDGNAWIAVDSGAPVDD